MNKEHITKREIFERIRVVRERLQENDIDMLAEMPNIIESLIDLETGVLQDCHK